MVSYINLYVNILAFIFAYPRIREMGIIISLYFPYSEMFK
ncbi:protein of unknown function [Clostridium beijerinckii]|nr:protein of unknown function [Clostridium beijerinckii]